MKKLPVYVLLTLVSLAILAILIATYPQTPGSLAISGNATGFSRVKFTIPSTGETKSVTLGLSPSCKKFDPEKTILVGQNFEEGKVSEIGIMFNNTDQETAPKFDLLTCWYVYSNTDPRTIQVLVNQMEREAHLQFAENKQSVRIWAKTNFGK